MRGGKDRGKNSSKKVGTTGSINIKSNILVLCPLLSHPFLLFSVSCQDRLLLGLALPILSTSNQEADPLIHCKTQFRAMVFSLPSCSHNEYNIFLRFSKFIFTDSLESYLYISQHCTPKCISIYQTGNLTSILLYKHRLPSDFPDFPIMSFIDFFSQTRSQSRFTHSTEFCVSLAFFVFHDIDIF